MPRHRWRRCTRDPTTRERRTSFSLEAEQLAARPDVRGRRWRRPVRGRCSRRRAAGGAGSPTTAVWRAGVATAAAPLHRASTPSATPTRRGGAASWRRSRRAARTRCSATSPPAALYGLVSWDDRRPEVIVCRRGRTASTRGSARHRTRYLPPTRRRPPTGIPITSPARTLLDLASMRRATRRCGGRCARPRRCDLIHHRPLAAALCTVPGPRAVARGCARIVATGPAPTRSELEDVVLDLLLGGGFAAPGRQRPARARRPARDPRLPLAGPAARLEADGAAWHDNRLAREDDAERQALLEAHGERVLRVTWEQAVARRAQTLRGSAPRRPADHVELSA